MTASAPTISYISGRMILGAEIDDGTGPEFVFHLPDALGSTRDVVDSSGNVIRSFEHDEYGNLISSWSSGTGAATPKTWIGGLSVNDDTADSGLWNMGHRNYAAGVLGRFISRDPIGFNGSSMNLYAYPTNPVSFTDSSGLNPSRHDWWYEAVNEGFSYLKNRLRYSKFRPEIDGNGIFPKCDGVRGSGNYSPVGEAPIRPWPGQPNLTTAGWDKAYDQFLDVNKLDGEAALRGGTKPSRFAKFPLPKFGPNTIILGFFLTLSVSHVANAEPCEKAQVASGEAAGWALGAAIAALLSRIPYGGPIGTGLFVASLVANAPTHDTPPPPIYGVGKSQPDPGREFDYRRNMD